MFEITEEQRRDILAYLAKKPYAEVAPLIAMLAALKRKKAGDTNGNVTSKKQWDRNRNYTEI